MELEQLIQETGEFPRQADPNKWLWDTGLITSKYDNQLSLFPISIDLLKFMDSQSKNGICYEIDYSAYADMFPFSFPIPFIAQNDETALESLKETIEEYNKEYSHPVFEVGMIKENEYYDSMYPGILALFADNPKKAMRIREASFDYFWMPKEGISWNKFVEAVV